MRSYGEKAKNTMKIVSNRELTLKRNRLQEYNLTLLYTHYSAKQVQSLLQFY